MPDEFLKSRRKFKSLIISGDTDDHTRALIWNLLIDKPALRHPRLSDEFVACETEVLCRVLSGTRLPSYEDQDLYLAALRRTLNPRVAKTRLNMDKPQYDKALPVLQSLMEDITPRPVTSRSSFYTLHQPLPLLR